MVYFLELGEGGRYDAGLIKIGHTSRLSRRLPQHEADFGCPLTVRGVHAGNRSAEQYVHATFSSDRACRKELFSPSPELLSYIERHTRPWTPELDDDPDFDLMLELMFWGPPVQWLRKMATNLGLKPDEEHAVVDRAIRHLAASHGIDLDGYRNEHQMPDCAIDLRAAFG